MPSPTGCQPSQAQLPSTTCLLALDTSADHPVLSGLVSSFGWYPDFSGLPHFVGNLWSVLASTSSTLSITALTDFWDDMVHPSKPSTVMVSSCAPKYTSG